MSKIVGRTLWDFLTENKTWLIVLAVISLGCWFISGNSLNNLIGLFKEPAKSPSPIIIRDTLIIKDEKVHNSRPSTSISKGNRDSYDNEEQVAKTAGEKTIIKNEGINTGIMAKEVTLNVDSEKAAPRFELTKLVAKNQSGNFKPEIDQGRKEYAVKNVLRFKYVPVPNISANSIACYLNTNSHYVIDISYSDRTLSSWKGGTARKPIYNSPTPGEYIVEIFSNEPIENVSDLIRLQVNGDKIYQLNIN